MLRILRRHGEILEISLQPHIEVRGLSSIDEQDEQDEEAPPVAAAVAEPESTAWIEVELLDEDDEPVRGEKYRAVLPDGKTKDGTLDANGVVRLVGLDPGNVKISFPNLDRDAWRRA